MLHCALCFVLTIAFAHVSNRTRAERTNASEREWTTCVNECEWRCRYVWHWVAIIEASYSFVFVRARFLGPAPALVSTLVRTPFTPFTSFSRVHLFSHVKPNPGRAGDRDQTWVNNFDECERYRDINGAVRADRSELFIRVRSRWSPHGPNPASYARIHANFNRNCTDRFGGVHAAPCYSSSSSSSRRYGSSKYSWIVSRALANIYNKYV